MTLLACPFCREMFRDRARKACPVCGVGLVPFEKLPSREALAEDGVPHQPEWDVLPATYLGRNRGLLALVAFAGIAAFFMPWVAVTMPDIVTYSGFHLAHERLGWAWGAGVAWFILVPTVLSRRTVMHMRGARVAATFLAAIPGVTAAVLIGRPPHGSHGVPVHFTWEWGLYATLGLSLLGVALGLFFGGRVDDIALRRGTSSGQVLH